MRPVFRILLVMMLCFVGGNAVAQSIKDASYHTVAHIKSDGTIQDVGYHTIGYIKSDGTVQNANYHIVGHVKSDGTVQNANYHTIGHAYGIPLRWAALYFFFCR